MPTHFYSCSPIPAKPTCTTISNKSILFPNPRISTARYHNNLVLSSSSSSAFPLRASISPADTSVAVEGPTTSTHPSKSLRFGVGHGFDLHRLEPGCLLIIGDVLLHCVVDVILGALGLPDIGQIFPDFDPKWKGAASSIFIVEKAVRLMYEAGYEIGNLDATLILQRRKLSPHKEASKANLSKLLGADPSVVNLKAKTHEKVDSLGEN